MTGNHRPEPRGRGAAALPHFPGLNTDSERVPPLKGGSKSHASMAANLLIFIELLVMLLAAQSSSGQTGPRGIGGKAGYLIKSQTNVVLVDVRVRDRSGKPVEGLKAADFKVYEDGKLQSVTSFSEENVQTLRQAAGTGMPPSVINLANLPPSANPGKVVQDHRLIVLFFDLTAMPVDDLTRALQAATNFINKQSTPADLVAVVIYSYELKVLQDFTNDRALLDKRLDAVRVGASYQLAESGTEGEAGTTDLSGNEVVTEDVSAAFTPDETEFNIFNTDEKLAALQSLAQILRDVPGRKLVIHFSSGIERTGLENDAQLQATVDAANLSNVSFYTMDARGLVALPPGGDAASSSPSGTALYTGQAMYSAVASLESGRETLAALAADTGGRTFYDTNDFSHAFQDIQEENSSYYLLGYTPTNSRSDGRFRRITVKVDRAGVKVEARPGYFGPKDWRQLTREDKEVQLQQAMDLDAPFVDLPFVVEPSYFRLPDGEYYVVLAAKIPGSELSFQKKSGTHETQFDFAWRAINDADKKPAGFLRDTLPVKLTGETYEQVLAGSILYEGAMVLPAGKYQLKAVVRENETGKIGTFEVPLVLPGASASGISLSSVVLSNQLEQPGAQPRRMRLGQNDPLQVGGRALVPSVTRVFRTNQTLYVYLQSYVSKQMNSPPVSSSSAVAPRVGLVFFRGGIRIADAGPFDGKVLSVKGQKVQYLLEIPLTKFHPGRYLMQANVLDPAIDRVAFARVPLAIIPPPKRPSPKSGNGN
jgi:VWFA-related protein